ncbi:hypothetical protein TRFO_35429 [Tritrichomonas foetus]|uniref:DNA-directed RNA polymerase III subunit RPC3 n=1 Tax=Tritrichomonas foetus TaxID=1144522 RepID=A0A1J4JKX7_9EUKA|nr:hypothetical protein TRFO_35429 [Tritrichomonas foetus]|eukprot:OHS98227.1 hypothetical protein TRFO_35429 [Tritrichomonas foetus]
MEEAARCWGSNHDDLLLKLCFIIAEQMISEDCCLIIRSITDAVNDLDELQKITELPDLRFRKAITKLQHKQIITIDPLEVNIYSIFNKLLYPHFIKFAEDYSLIPQDKPYIEKIARKVLDEPTLNSEKLVGSLTTKHKGLDSIRLSIVIDYLIKKNVLVEDSDNAKLKFNFGRFLSKQREAALLQFVELNDRRVYDVVRALFSDDLYHDCLVTCSDTSFNEDDVICHISEETGLSNKEINSIFGILKTPEYSFISPTDDILTPSRAINIFKIKKIGHLLTEIGYPLAKRVINLLIRKESLEGNSICESILLTTERGRELLEKMYTLGILEKEALQDAPHTTLKRQYVVWKISSYSALNNASAYLIGVLAKLYADLLTEQATMEKESGAGRNQENDENRKRRFDEKTQILQNTMFSVTKRYIEIHEL